MTMDEGGPLQSRAMARAVSAAVAWRVGWHAASQDAVWCMEAAQPWWVAGVARVCAWQMACTVEWHVRGLHGGRWRLWRSVITGPAMQQSNVN